MADEFAEDYKLALQQLTFNSKPIITSLTMIAQESQWAASSITCVIEDRLTDPSVSDRLPTLYLMDSILKNVGGIYIQEFAVNLYKTFTFVYEDSDAARKQKLERLLTTWKDIFDEPLLFSIRKYVTESKVGIHAKSVQAVVPVVPLNLLDSIQQVQEMLMSSEQRQLLKLLQQRKQQPGNFAIQQLLSLLQSKPLPADQVAAIGLQVQALTQNSGTSQTLADLYENLRLVCKQCGFRFSDEQTDSMNKFQAHMDWHFRQNKKVNDKSSSSSREWFVTEEKWLLPESDESEQEVSAFQKQVDTAAQVQVVPYIEEQGKVCTICNETFETVWDDATEKWMLVDAIRIDSKIYHSSCYNLQHSPVEEPVVRKRRKVKK